MEAMQLGAAKKQTLSGPAGPGAARAGWDSAILELHRAAHSEDHFILELWTFKEWYSVPPEVLDTPNESDTSKTCTPGELDAFGRPRASKRSLDEVRVTLTGSACAGKVPGIRLQGFERSEANQDFARDDCRLVDGLPTWWSSDGLHFLYYAQEYSHWKLNALRIAGGDGLQAVGAGGRKAGRGYAHSGVPQACPESVALTSGDGWFECIRDEWEPVLPAVTSIQVNILDFQAHRAEVQERSIRGPDSSSAKRSGEPQSFRGWCHTSSGRNSVRLMLPQVLDASEDGDVALVQDTTEEFRLDIAEVGNESGYRGDPDVLVLQEAAASRL